MDKNILKKIAHFNFHPSLRGRLVVTAVIAASSAVVTAVVPAAVLPRVLRRALVVSAARSIAAASAAKLTVSPTGGAVTLSGVTGLVPPPHLLPLLTPERLSFTWTATAGTAATASTAATAAVPSAGPAAVAGVACTPGPLPALRNSGSGKISSLSSVLVVHQARPPENEKRSLAKGLASKSSLFASRQLLSAATLHSRMFLRTNNKISTCSWGQSGPFHRQPHSSLNNGGGCTDSLCRGLFLRLAPEGGVSTPKKWRFGPLFRWPNGRATSNSKGIFWLKMS